MKQINPATGVPYKQGDTRPDGKIFVRHYPTRLRKTGFFAVYWASKDQFQKEIFRHDKEISNRCSLIWKKKNPHKHNANCAKYEASKLKRTPPWLTKDHYKTIEQFYKDAKQKSIDTGISHEVDHIVPLQGETVSGLHVPWNLQILTKSENASKNNRH